MFIRSSSRAHAVTLLTPLQIRAVCAAQNACCRGCSHQQVSSPPAPPVHHVLSVASKCILSQGAGRVAAFERVRVCLRPCASSFVSSSARADEMRGSVRLHTQHAARIIFAAAHYELQVNVCCSETVCSAHTHPHVMHVTCLSLCSHKHAVIKYALTLCIRTLRFITVFLSLVCVFETFF
jgi:hypothetical protein